MSLIIRGRQIPSWVQETGRMCKFTVEFSFSALSFPRGSETTSVCSIQNQDPSHDATNQVKKMGVPGHRISVLRPQRDQRHHHGGQQRHHPQGHRSGQ